MFKGSPRSFTHRHEHDIFCFPCFICWKKTHDFGTLGWQSLVNMNKNRCHRHFPQDGSKKAESWGKISSPHHPRKWWFVKRRDSNERTVFCRPQKSGFETHGSRGWKLPEHISGEVISLQVGSFSFIFSPGLNAAGTLRQPLKTNIAGLNMDPEWRSISHWTWGIF